MDARLPDRLRDAGPWTTVYEAGPVRRAIAWPFEKLASVYRALERIGRKFAWLFRLFGWR